MGQHDGHIKDNIYLTSDLSLAAYLLLWGFSLLGAIDNETKRMEFGLVPPPNTDSLEELIDHLLKEFSEKDYREYSMKVRDLRYALTNPIRRHL